MDSKFQNKNEIKIVGKLTKANLKTGKSAKTGQNYVSATAVVVSNIKGVDNEFEVSFFANEMTADNKPSELFKSYSKMPELEGKKVEITGSLRENRFFSSNLNQIVSTQELSGRFIKGVADSVPDEASWLVSGFIAKSLVEKINKNNEVYRYDVTLAQVNYDGKTLSMYTLHVNPIHRNIIAALEKYEVGQTIRLYGSLNFKTEVVTVEDKNEGGFGEPIYKTFTNKQKNFYIEGGSAPIVDETKYDSMTISDLISAYKARDVELAEKGKTNEPVAVEKTTQTITKRQASLI